jgi:hypothetical protein
VRDYLGVVRDRLAVVPTPEASELIEEWRDLFERVASSGPVEELTLGAWHGDWTRSNCAQRRGRVLLWDWERFERAVPVGFDALHFRFNQDAGKGWPRALPAARGVVEQAEAVLAPWRLSLAAARATAQLYLLDIASRYVADQADPTIAGGRVSEWAFPALRSTLPA